MSPYNLIGRNRNHFLLYPLNVKIPYSTPTCVIPAKEAVQKIPSRSESVLFSPPVSFPRRRESMRKVDLFQIVGMDPRLRGDDTEWLQESLYFSDLYFLNRLECGDPT